MMLRQPVTFPVASCGRPDREFSISGWLSVPAGRVDLLLLLVHGGFYTHAYWDMPYRPEVYSFVEWAYERGLATLNIDRLGNGDSDHPAGAELDLAMNAEAVAEIIDHIRQDGVSGERFTRIAVVGHSFGSLTASHAQAISGCADALVLTGVPGANVHDLGPDEDPTSRAARVFTPALEDPTMADRSDRLDADYYVTRAAVRTKMFFRVPPTEPGIIAVDDRLRGTMTLGEIRTMWQGFDVSADIDVPALVQFGQHDRYLYDPVTEPDCRRIHEDAIRRSHARATHAPLVTDAGHCLTLHPGAHEGYEVIGAWLRDEELI